MTTPGQIYIRPGRDPYQGHAVMVAERAPGDAARNGSKVLVHRLVVRRAGAKWADDREWMDREMRGWVAVDALPAPGEVPALAYPDGYFSETIAANVDALVEADHRDTTEVARACFPASPRPTALLLRLRGKTTRPSMPTDGNVRGLVSGLELASMAPIFAVDTSPTLDEHATAELVVELQRRGHTVDLDRPTIHTVPHAGDGVVEAVFEAIREQPSTISELQRSIEPTPSEHHTRAAIKRLADAGEIGIRRAGNRLRWAVRAGRGEDDSVADGR